MKAAIYCRYSSDMQREESAEAQIRACEEYAAIKGYDIVNIYSDKALSAKGSKIKKRVQFHQMMADSSKGIFDTVLIHKYNRFARNERDHVNYEGILNDNSVTLIATAEDFGQGKQAIIVKALMRAMSQYYIEDMADEVRKGHKENALKAQHNGGYSPFGYDVVDKQYVINEFEASYVKKMFQCAIERKGFKDLIEEMEAVGIKGKRGKFIKYPSIYEILRNERYTGTYVYAIVSDKNDRRAKKNAIRIDDAMPQIVSREMWEEVQKIMDTRKQSGRNAGYLCKGLVYCKDCGAKMNGHITNSRGTEYRTYICTKSCGVGTVKMDFVDDTVKEYVQKLLSDDTMHDLAIALRKYTKGEKNRVENYNQAMQKEIADKQKQYDGYMDKLAMDLPSEIVKEIGSKMKQLKSEVEALGLQESPKDYTEQNIIKWLEAIKDSPSDETVHLLIEKIYANKKEISIESTLTSLLPTIVGNLGGDTPQHIFPTILFNYDKSV